MSSLSPFITAAYRPKIHGATLDKTHQTYFFIKNQIPKSTQFCHAICFGPKKDKVLVNLEHCITPKDKIFIFYYEDLNKRWSYVQTQTQSYFVYQKNQSETLMIHPKCLYIRGCYIKAHTPMWHTVGRFYSFINTWRGKILCSPQSQCSNESKLYQLHQCLKKAAQNTPVISIGKSHVLKGSDAYTKAINKKTYIVKSLSGIRSIVVDSNIYKHWPKQNLAHLPVLFQEKVTGHDLRVHVIQNQTFSKQAVSKTHTDYRYDPAFFKLKTIKNLPKPLKQFASAVASLENNALIGLDFIQTDTHYVVLEANPSPGWSAYHECNGIQTPPFIKALIRALSKPPFSNKHAS